MIENAAVAVDMDRARMEKSSESNARLALLAIDVPRHDAREMLHAWRLRRDLREGERWIATADEGFAAKRIGREIRHDAQGFVDAKPCGGGERREQKSK
ncbi:MAG: hypothetical protein KDJ25_09725 [Rhodoblastus sp.]|nr:hypothetical protein [Rhodoblastus sp.]